MARRVNRLMLGVEALELVLQEGSDDEEGVFASARVDQEEDESESESDFDPREEEIRCRSTSESSENDDEEVDLRSRSRSRSMPGPSTESRPDYTRPGPVNRSRSRSRVDEEELDAAFDVHLDPEVMNLDLDEEQATYMSDWVSDLTDFPMVPPFTGNPGLQVDMGEDPKPLDFYMLFITDDIIKQMKQESNRYARQTIYQKEHAGVHLSPRSMFRTWKPVSKKEVYRFLALLIHMALIDKPRIQHYWSKDPVLRSTFAPQVMQRERFKAILSFFHLNDNTSYIARGQPGHDPLHKIRPLHNHLKECFMNVYSLKQNICIDEAMCPWRGRSYLRVYMKDKPMKWGIKFYELCESSSGYVWSFEIMHGDTNLSNKPFDVVHRLIDPLLNKGHCLYVDNYYCNPALCDSLSANNTMVVGTVRANRIGLPRDFMNKPLATGEMDFRRQNQVSVIRWKDKREVNILTTKHLPEMVEHRTRTDVKMKPTAVIDYSANMCGVDLNDQLIAYNPMHRKTIKWWKKLAFHMLSLTLVQAFILHNEYLKASRKKPWQLCDFAKAVCLALVMRGGQLNEAAEEERLVDRLSGRHFLVPIDEDNPRKRGSCHVCYKRAKKDGATRAQLKNQASRTTFKCNICKNAFCVYPCFIDYHTKDDFLA
ncbi:PiggyBac transposable element-derived protein 4 [Plakobranchus ocellatus]|uniref:PiggyBac transposable element-derived protein 4 n=1 Tax=Plakobranchus ocellatus TaxID=259542 RepID=A0AAV3ZS13_9GAST|nr:PiggyBac transposable element-derived protein 4 [Plakobranchus ocellatus]